MENKHTKQRENGTISRDRFDISQTWKMEASVTKAWYNVLAWVTTFINLVSPHGALYTQVMPVRDVYAA